MTDYSGGMLTFWQDKRGEEDEVNTVTFTKAWKCPDCGKDFTVGQVESLDTCCGKAVEKAEFQSPRPVYSHGAPVQVVVFGSEKRYTYSAPVGVRLQVGDKVEVPIGRRTTVAAVVEIGSEYKGVCKSVLRLVEKAATPSSQETTNPEEKPCSTLSDSE